MPIRTGTLAQFETELGDAAFAIVDLTARAYDGIAAIEVARRGRRPGPRGRPA